ncbi:hypothetical protein ACFQ71_41515, partial [Streptomyces sp. NPDC056534]
VTGSELWQAASATGADLLRRVRKNIVLPVLETFEDGSYLSGTAASGRPQPPQSGPGPCHRIPASTDTARTPSTA